MTQRDMWNRYRAWLYDAPGLGFRLDVSRMDLPDREGASIEVEPGATSGDFLSGFFQGTRRALHENGRG